MKTTSALVTSRSSRIGKLALAGWWMAAPYVNQTELRRAFLLALLRARPELRISADVYTLCEVHPATLAHDSKQKWFFRLGMAVLIASTCYVSMSLLAEVAAIWAIAGTLSTFAAGTILLVRAQIRLFTAPEHPRAVALRHSALAADEEQNRTR